MFQAGADQHILPSFFLCFVFDFSFHLHAGFSLLFIEPDQASPVPFTFSCHQDGAFRPGAIWNWDTSWQTSIEALHPGGSLEAPESIQKVRGGWSLPMSVTLAVFF